MKKIIHSVALAALLIPSLLFADTVEVTFDAALTNATGWVYDSGFEYVSTQKKYGFISGNNNHDQVISPTFDFAITSVVINAERASDKTTRKMSIRATSGNAPGDAVELVDDIIPSSQVSFTITNIWNVSDAVRSFSLLTTGGNGNLYLTKAIISGVPLIAAPTGLQANNIKGTRFSLSWENPETAVSNRIDVFRTLRHEETGSTLAEYDFLAFTNTGINASARFDKTTLQIESYPEFSGMNVYAAGNSTGVVQISSSDAQGYLRYDLDSVRDSLDSAVNAFLSISAKQQQVDVSSNWKLAVYQVSDNGVTNRTDLIAIGDEFPARPFFIEIDDKETCKAIVMRPSDTTKKNRRILVDSIAFVRDYVPAHVETNLVKTAFVEGSTTYSVRGLSPRTEYVAKITAFDADGNESSPSEPLAVSTNGEKHPFAVHIQ